MTGTTADATGVPVVQRGTLVAAYGLVVEARRKLLLVRVAPGYAATGQWTLPGGGIDFGEDPAHAAVRELAEETGYRGDVEGLAFVSSVTGGALPELGWGEYHKIRIVYRMRITGGELRNEVDESTDMAAWHPVQDIDRLPVTDLVHGALRHIATP